MHQFFRPVLHPGDTCWRIERAERIAFLIDGEAYFRALHAAITRARYSILILAWGIDPDFRLLREPSSGQWPVRLGDLLTEVVSRRPRLRVHILDWDFAMLAPVAGLLPIYQPEWKIRHRRIRFRMDDRHPLGSSHHQKVVVIDDRVAFSGGIDITRGRWDTPAHLYTDERRSDGEGRPTFPYHDAQMALSGPVAAALGDLARMRWARATRRMIKKPPPTPEDPWPPELAPDVVGTDVGISRTEPQYAGRPEVREIESLFLASIAAARRSIYIENQFFTSERIATALAKRLSEPDGPEIVLLLPLMTDSWISHATMDVMRGRLIHRLKDADRHDRFRVFYPHREGNELPINLHAKVMIIDDALARIGSANLSNRSMGLDTECDVTLEAAGRPDVSRAIAALRHRLLAEHLGTSPQRIERALAETASLIRLIETAAPGDRTLKPLEVPNPPEPSDVLYDEEVIDPERPVDPNEYLRQFVREEERPTARRAIGGWVGLLLFVLIAAAAWRWTPLGQWIDIDHLVHVTERLRALPVAPLFVLGAFLIGSLIAVPVTLMILATMLAFGTVPGLTYALAGVIVGALAGYWLGYLFGRDIVRRFAGHRINELSRRLARHSVLAVLAVRIIPVAPFTAVNLVAGASRIRLRYYLLGTVLGVTPGMTAIAFFADRVQAIVTSPDAFSIASLMIVLTLIALALIGLHRWLGKKEGRGG
jgi:phospholipase D1/2